jgi:monoamine oxidase
MIGGAEILRAAGDGATRADVPEKVDVVIVGAGISGLVTARELVKAGVRSVVVLEARSRVGGRTIYMPIAGGNIVEGGGEWIGPHQTEIHALAKELGIGTFDTYNTGKIVFCLGGQRVLGDSLDASGSSGAQAVIEAAGKLEALAQTVVLDAPWTTPNAAALDKQTLAGWISANVKDPTAGFHLGNVMSTAVFGNPATMSLLFTLFQAKSVGGVAPMITVKGGDEQSRFVGGSQLVSLKMAQQLGSRAMLNSPVNAISRWDRGPVAIDAAGRKFRAKQVVVAMMPADNRRIAFAPALPPMRAGLIRNFVAGVGTKFNIVYARPFWREKGLDGQSMSYSPTLITTLDNSPPSGKPGVIVGFTQGPWPPREPEAQRAAVARAVAKVFGPEALKPVGYETVDWAAQRWTARCVTPLPPGFLTRYGAAMRPAIGRIVWGGAESSPISYGGMDGAVRAGIRAAKEVQERL